MPRDALILMKENCHPKCARKVSGLPRNRPQSADETLQFRRKKRAAHDLIIPQEQGEFDRRQFSVRENSQSSLSDKQCSWFIEMLRLSMQS